MTSLFELLRKQLENQFLTGGAVLVVFTALLALMRRVPEHVFELLKRQLITTIDIADHDQAFFWVQKWLGDQPYTKERARLLTVTTRTLPVGHGKEAGPTPASYVGKPKRQLTEVVFSPAPGLHLLRYRGHWILLSRNRKEGEGVFGEVAYHETLTFQTFSRDVVRELIYEAREAAFPPEDNRIAILRPNYHNWRTVQRRLPRSMDSVILDGDIIESLLTDLRWFFGASTWYSDHGIPYQRGYMLYGPPGTGKTSLVVAIASAFGRDIHIINLSGVTDSMMIQLMAELPEHAIVLIEDVDSIFEQRKKTSDTNEDLSFSGFINAIDGVSAPPGRVLFMTTNHLEKLDPAIMRPGRADRKLEFHNATADMACRLFLQFFPGEETLAKQYGEKFGTGAFSMAALQENLIKYRESPTEALV